MFPARPCSYTDRFRSYQCPFCDGLEHSGQPVGILGFENPMTINLALSGLRFDDRVIIFTNGKETGQDEATQNALKMALARGVKMDDRKIKRFIDNGPGDQDGMTIEFHNGESFLVGCLFHHLPTVNRAQHLIEQLGVETTAPGSQQFGMGGEVVLKQGGETNVQGCYAAGDTSTMQKAGIAAITSGGTAGAFLSMALSMDEGKAALAVNGSSQL